MDSKAVGTILAPNYPNGVSREALRVSKENGAVVFLGFETKCLRESGAMIQVTLTQRASSQRLASGWVARSHPRAKRRPACSYSWWLTMKSTTGVGSLRDTGK